MDLHKVALMVSKPRKQFLLTRNAQETLLILLFSLHFLYVFGSKTQRVIFFELNKSLYLIKLALEHIFIP